MGVGIGWQSISLWVGGRDLIEENFVLGIETGVNEVIVTVLGDVLVESILGGFFPAYFQNWIGMILLAALQRAMTSQGQVWWFG